MDRSKTVIPYCTDINEFLSSTFIDHRSDNPIFYCLKLCEHEGDIYKPPFGAVSTSSRS